MEKEVLEQVQRISSEALAAIVRLDQRDSAFNIIGWSVDQLSNQGIPNSDGLWRYSGTGVDGNGVERAWTVVLKRITDRKEPENLHSMWYEMRDAMMYESGLLTTLPGTLACPRCYGVWRAADACSIWMEYILDSSPPRWTTTEHGTAARALGRMSGYYLAGQPLPDLPWLCREHARSWIEACSPGLDWNNTYVQRYISPSLRARFERLLTERERFFAAMNRLPQVFSHFDFHRRNLKIRPDNEGKAQVVVFDWSQAGTGPVGSELFGLVGVNTALFESTPSELPELEEVVLREYTDGVRASGAQVDLEIIRLGYMMFGGMYYGTTIPACICIWTREGNEERVRKAFGVENDTIAQTWAEVGEFYISQAEQALVIMDRLGL